MSQQPKNNDAILQQISKLQKLFPARSEDELTELLEAFEYNIDAVIQNLNEEQNEENKNKKDEKIIENDKNKEKTDENKEKQNKNTENQNKNIQNELKNKEIDYKVLVLQVKNKIPSADEQEVLELLQVMNGNVEKVISELHEDSIVKNQQQNTKTSQQTNNQQNTQSNTAIPNMSEQQLKDMLSKFKPQQQVQNKAQDQKEKSDNSEDEEDDEDDNDYDNKALNEEWAIKNKEIEEAIEEAKRVVAEIQQTRKTEEENLKFQRLKNMYQQQLTQVQQAGITIQEKDILLALDKHSGNVDAVKKELGKGGYF